MGAVKDQIIGIIETLETFPDPQSYTACCLTAELNGVSIATVEKVLEMYWDIMHS